MGLGLEGIGKGNEVEMGVAEVEIGVVEVGVGAMVVEEGLGEGRTQNGYCLVSWKAAKINIKK